VKAVSVSAELTTIQRAVEGAALLVEVGRHGGVENEDTGALVSAILALAAVRLRDLGRAGRGTLDVESFWAPHGAAVDDSDMEDLILYPAKPSRQVESRGARDKACTVRRPRPYSTLSFAFACWTDCHCMLPGSSRPPRFNART